MNILILNWRDIKNPKSGGAEILTHEIAKSWVKMGHQVTIFSSSFSGSLSVDIVDNIRIIRRGNADIRFLFSSVHFQAFLYYIQNSKNFDVVIDEVHGIPFFTPWYVKKKKVVLICEVAGDLWGKMFGPFFGSIGRIMELFYLNYTYKNVPFLTISESTKDELVKEGVNEKKITVLPMGATLPEKVKIYKKEKNLTLIFVGRLAKSKGIEDSISALAMTSKIHNNIKLWIVGGGEESYIGYLKKMAKKFKVDHKVIFFGFVSQAKKFELMRRAHILVAPSLKEGWGLIVPEAAFVGTPSIVYNSPGLRDVLKGSTFKIITKSNTPQALSDEILNLLSQDFTIYAKEKLDTKDLSWDRTAKAAFKIISI